MMPTILPCNVAANEKNLKQNSVVIDSLAMLLLMINGPWIGSDLLIPGVRILNGKPGPTEHLHLLRV